ncbi:hypothetical protein [Abyssalbus ytuae]|uniref:Uncharacterized protein n=1 Tax=Abyssalbus ytuae TaxID=2926907 RepID=A0A9E6ZVD1_9FLAO|nr:hypothetical protein [Abyssalbus ytuae]UOB18478.1 hypothetical protein MQE35_04100 [Abyssalbus ytuae]
MKTKTILLLAGLTVYSSLACSQVVKDSLQAHHIYPRFNGYFSVEESWQIHKEAYKKQLEAKGLTEQEISQKMKEYEKQKEEVIEKIKQQRRVAEKQRQLADIQRQKADSLRKMAAAQRLEHDKQRQKADALRKMADTQRQQAEKQRQQAEVMRREAEAQRKIAEEKRKIEEEWRKSIKVLLGENVPLVVKDTGVKPLKINVSKRSTLFFNIYGNINSGRVLIEVFNPNGQKEAELALDHHKETVPQPKTRLSDNTSGSLSKTINSPKTGAWIVKISPQKCRGTINISVAQYIKPAADE